MQHKETETGRGSSHIYLFSKINMLFWTDVNIINIKCIEK